MLHDAKRVITRNHVSYYSPTTPGPVTDSTAYVREQDTRSHVSVQQKKGICKEAQVQASNESQAWTVVLPQIEQFRIVLSNIQGSDLKIFTAIAPSMDPSHAGREHQSAVCSKHAAVIDTEDSTNAFTHSNKSELLVPHEQHESNQQHDRQNA